MCSSSRSGRYAKPPVASTTPRRGHALAAIARSCADAADRPAGRSQQPARWRVKSDRDPPTFQRRLQEAPQRRAAVRAAADDHALADGGRVWEVRVSGPGISGRERRRAQRERLCSAPLGRQPGGQRQNAVDVGRDHRARGAALGDRQVVLNRSVTVGDRRKRAARLGRAPARRPGLLEHDDRGAVIMSLDRCGSPGAAGTAHHDIEVVAQLGHGGLKMAHAAASHPRNRSGGRPLYASCVSCASIAATTRAASGSVCGRNRATARPARLTMNFSKFHSTSPATPASSVVLVSSA